MMMSSNWNIFRVTGPLCGEFTDPGEFPTQRPVTRSFDVYFDLRLNKRLCKQSWGWWFQTLLCPLWRHSNVMPLLQAHWNSRLPTVHILCCCLIITWFVMPWPCIQHLNTLRSRQNVCHFADDIFKCIFLKENVLFPIEMSLKFVP